MSSVRNFRRISGKSLRMLTSNAPEVHLESALSAVRSGDAYQAVVDALPVPTYITDAHGAVTHWNRACVAFAGREPRLGSDRWCVTWQLYTVDGVPMPHDQCPMATAIKERRAVRNEVAIAMRPDGSRAAFTPYPTPLFDDDGALTGAINLLVDVSASQAEALDEQACRCRRLAQATHDQQASTMLQSMAADYDDTAAALRCSKA